MALRSTEHRSDRRFPVALDQFHISIHDGKSHQINMTMKKVKIKKCAVTSHDFSLILFLRKRICSCYIYGTTDVSSFIATNYCNENDIYRMTDKQTDKQRKKTICRRFLEA